MPDCQHERTEFLYRRDGVDYVRCLDCDQVLEAEDLDTVSVYDDEEEQPKRQPHTHPHRH
jgi:Zn ribbon nucleic-acid-binding protein